MNSQDPLNQISGDQVLRDYKHASKIFLPNGYVNVPRYKFLFHVYFNLNLEVPSIKSIYSPSNISNISVLVKTAQLPTFKIATDVLNQYNRKRVIQKKIDYDPVQITFHDDGGDLTRNLWYNYYSYYYSDPRQQYNSEPATNGTSGANQNNPVGFDYNSRDIYIDNRVVNDWGYIGEGYIDNNKTANGKAAFFKDITIYGLNQHKFAQYTLINPIITQWDHDQYDYAEGGGLMTNKVTIQYETVKYYSGAIGGDRPDTNVSGFADPAHYDQESSPLTRPSGRASAPGQGSTLNTGIGITQDLQAGSVLNPVGGPQQSNIQYNLPNTAQTPGAAVVANNGLPAAMQTGLPGAVVASPNATAGNNNMFPTPPANSGITGESGAAFGVVGRRRK